MVWHPVLHRWRSRSHFSRRGVASLQRHRRRSIAPRTSSPEHDHVLHLLGAQHRDRVGRHQRGARLRELVGANHHAPRALALVVGGATRGRTWTNVRPALIIHDERRVLESVRSITHRHDRILGNPESQHSRLHSLRQRSEAADVGTGTRTSNHDARVQRDGSHYHECIGDGALWLRSENAVGSSCCLRPHHERNPLVFLHHFSPIRRHASSSRSSASSVSPSQRSVRTSQQMS